MSLFTTMAEFFKSLSFEHRNREILSKLFTPGSQHTMNSRRFVNHEKNPINAGDIVVIESTTQIKGTNHETGEPNMTITLQNGIELDIGDAMDVLGPTCEVLPYNSL